MSAQQHETDNVDALRAARRDPDAARDTNPNVDEFRATTEKKDFK